MEFTFGIITNIANDNILKIIESIENLKINKYEIIIVGGINIYNKNIIHIPFNETIKPSWITKKKNIICNKASYENIVLLHDYILFSNDWYEGFLKFGNDFDVCVTKIVNKNGRRFRDYTLYPYFFPKLANNIFKTRALLPYDYSPSHKLSKLSYISGSYYIIKKNVALKYPLNENLVWGQSEDVYLSKQLVLNNYTIKCNSFSTVKFLKDKNQAEWENELTENELRLIENLTSEQIDVLHCLQMNELKKNMYEAKVNIDDNLFSK
jgi:hypothetical protein